MVVGIAGITVLHKLIVPMGKLELFVAMISLLLVLTLLEALVLSREGRYKHSDVLDSSIEVIGKTGTVQKPCSPQGTVKIGPTVWGAVSIDGEPLESGTQIVVIDRKDLKLNVRKAGHESV